MLLLPSMQVLQLTWLIHFMLSRFSSQASLHCLHPSVIGLITYSAVSSPLAALQAFFACLVFFHFDG